MWTAEDQYERFQDKYVVKIIGGDAEYYHECHLTGDHYPESKMMFDKDGGFWFRRDLLNEYVLSCGQDDNFKNQLIKDNESR